MKRVIKYISILSIMLCTLGFMTGVYADNEQGAVSSVTVEEQLADINDRLTEVEKLSKDELIEHYLRNEDKITAHADFWMGVMGAFVTAMSIAVVIFGAIFPYIRQKKSKKELQKLNNEINGLRGYIDDTKKEMKAYTYFAMANNEKDTLQQIELYNKAIELHPQYMEAYNNRGNAYYELNHFEEALDDYNQAIQIEPDAFAYNGKGSVYLQYRNYTDALKNYNKAIEIFPDYANAYYNRAVTYEEIKNYNKALEDYNTAIELNPNNTDAYYNRSFVYKVLGEREKAKQDMQTYERLQNDGDAESKTEESTAP